MASQPEVNANVEDYPDSDGNDNGVDADVNSEEYMESEDVLSSATEQVDNPSPATHRHDRTPNAKRKRGGSDADIVMLCKAIQDLVRLMENECCTCAKSTLPGNEDRFSISTFMSFLNDMIELEDELYCKAMKRCIESQGWREAFMASAPERRMGILKNLK